MTSAKLPLSAILTCAIATQVFSGGHDPSPPSNPLNQEIPPEVRKIAAKHLKCLGEPYRAHYDQARNIICISALDPKHHAETIRLLNASSDAFSRTFGASKPQWLITVLLPTVEDYRPLAPSEKVKGFYEPSQRTLTSIDRGSVLVHEFTHALHHADSDAAGQVHPIWIKEGLATLFESAAFTASEFLPHVGVRVLTLQRAVRLKQLIPLNRLMSLKPKAFARDADLCYAQARYLMLYLHRKGKLGQWYRTYKSGYSEDPSARKALVKVLGKPLPQIEREWQDWAAGLELPWGQVRSAQGRLGLQMRDTREGVKVIGFDENSPAQQAERLQIGDVILKFNGHETKSTADVIGAIRNAGALQTVTIEVRRKGRVVTIHQPLGSAKSGAPNKG